MHLLAWIILILCIIGSIVGTLLPGVPGTVLILVGALIHKWIYPNILNQWVIFGIAVLALLSWGIDFVGVMIGSRFGRASKFGLTGAVIGATLGVFFPPIGFLIGPAIGAALGELIARRTLPEALKSGVGAGGGTILSLFLRIGFNLIAIVTIILDLFIN